MSSATDLKAILATYGKLQAAFLSVILLLFVGYIFVFAAYEMRPGFNIHALILALIFLAGVIHFGFYVSLPSAQITQQLDFGLDNQNNISILINQIEMCKVLSHEHRAELLLPLINRMSGDNRYKEMLEGLNPTAAKTLRNVLGAMKQDLDKRIVSTVEHTVFSLSENASKMKRIETMMCFLPQKQTDPG